jgi:CheY-like chemotaxis protein
VSQSEPVESEDEDATNTIAPGTGKSGLKSLPAANFNRSDIDLFFVDEVGDDRTDIKPGDKVLLIAEDNLTFAKIMLDQAHENGIKAIVTTKGHDVIDFINHFNPDAITMDLNMPDTSGWKILDRLKTDFNLRHIPVYIISGEDERNKGLKRGARNFLLKPVKNDSLHHLFNDISNFKDKKTKNLLVVDDNETELTIILEAVTGTDINVSSARTVKEAIAFIKETTFDCIILDLKLPDANGMDIISDIENNIAGHDTAIIIHSAGDVNKMQKNKLNRFAHRIITKSANSLDQLVDQTALFMHRVHKELPAPIRERIEMYYMKEDVLSGKKVLIVDDDVRNLFALTTALERFNLETITAESGKEAIDILNKNANIDIVLMDIMMPEMDGYETMKNIRKKDKHKDLTIIAVTAKAMKGDRQKCIESGASDYITKPVNVDQLSSLMRVWLKQ